jgi:hypothetical protein
LFLPCHYIAANGKADKQLSRWRQLHFTAKNASLSALFYVFCGRSPRTPRRYKKANRSQMALFALIFGFSLPSQQSPYKPVKALKTQNKPL